MSRHNDLNITKAVELWSGQSDLTTPQAIATIIDNTGEDRTSAHIDGFLSQLMAASQDLDDAAFKAAYPNTARDALDELLITTVRDFTIERSARTKKNPTLDTMDRRLHSEDDIVFRFAHMDFLASDTAAHNAPGRATIIPSSLMVRRSHMNKKIDTLRSPSSPVAVAQDPAESIMADFVFPNMESVNGFFRTMYSTVQMMPVLTIESPLITAAFINGTDFPELYNKAVAQRVSSIGAVEQIKENALKNLDNAIELTRTDSDLTDVILDRIRQQAVANVASGKQPGKLDSLLNSVSTAIGVAVKSMTINTIPGSPGAIMVRVTFVRAHIPMLEKGQPIYLDQQGNPTHSARDAYWLNKYCETLKDSNIAGDRFLKPVDLSDPDWDEFSLKWENIYGQEEFISLNTSSAIETQTSLTTGFKIASLNLSNASSPQVQHMGRVNVSGAIVIETKDLDFVADLASAKAKIRMEARDGLLKRNSAEVVHPLLNMLGVKRISLTDIAIQETQDNPELKTITIGVIENAFNIEDVESIKLVSGGINNKLFDAFWDFLTQTTEHAMDLKSRNLFDHWYLTLTDSERFTYDIVDKAMFGGSKTGILKYPSGFFTGDAHHLIRAGINRLFFLKTQDISNVFYKSNSSDDMNGQEVHLEWASQTLFELTEGGTASHQSRHALRGTQSHISVLGRLGYEQPVLNTSSNQFDRQPVPQELWDAMLYVLKRGDGDLGDEKAWSSESLKVIVSTLTQVMDSSEAENFVSLPKYGGGSIKYRNRDILAEMGRVENETKRNRAATNFVDLVLPTYEELFRGATDSQGNPVWEKFAPRFSDLGVRPRVTNETAYLDTQDAMDATAHKESDLVSPGSFFYRPRNKQFMSEFEFDDDDYVDTVTVQVPIDQSTLLKSTGAESFKDLTSVSLAEALSSVNFNSAADDIVAAKDDKKKVIDVIDSDGQLIAYYTRTGDGSYTLKKAVGRRRIFRSGDQDPGFNTSSRRMANSLVKDGLTHSPDLMSNMDKCFPAIRIYLVEEDRSFRTLFDDLYSISAIESVSVTKDQDDADTAIIKLSNTSGYLSEDSFTPKGLSDDFDDDGEPFLSRFKVNYGTHIVVKMGYAARPDELKTVFTGAVAQFHGGDSITMIAQGFKTELFNQVGLFSEKGTWNEINRPHLRNVLNNILDRNGSAPHLGRKTVLNDPHSDKSEALINDLYGSDSGFATSFWKNPFRYIGESWGGRNINDIARNIYYDSNIYFSPEFTVPTMSAYDAINEVVKYAPNFITDVVPYGNDATLFVGDPSSQYKYRDTTAKEDRLFDEVAAVDSDDTAGIAGGLTNLIEDYKDSAEYKAYEENSGNRNERRLDDMHTIGFFGGHKGSLTTKRISESLSDDIHSRMQGKREIIEGLDRKLFAYFFGFDPNTTRWDRGLQGQWKELSKNMLKPWYDATSEQATGGFVNTVSMLSDSPEIQSRLTVTTAPVSRVENSLLTDSKSGVVADRLVSDSGALKIYNGGATDGKITDHIYKHALHYREFVDSFMDFMESSSLSTANTSLPPVSLFASQMPPGYKSFRDYHFISSEQDIIENNITASDSEMWSSVVLKAPQVVQVEGFLSALWHPAEYLAGMEDPYEDGNLVQLDPAQDYVLWPNANSTPGDGVREGITFRGKSPTSEDILKAFHEPNALSPSAAEHVLMHRMCEGMSLMYRGNIVIVGRAIKPHDIINIRDNTTSMVGTFVAERVTHNFDPNFGWTTTIVPRALTFHNSNFAFETSSVWNELMNIATSDEVNGLMLIVGLAAAAVTLAGTGAGVAAGAAAMAIGRVIAAGFARVLTTGGTAAVSSGARRIAASSVGTFLKSGATATTQALGANAGLIGQTYFAHTVIKGGNKVVGATMNYMSHNAMRPSIADSKYPILVTPLMYHGRPYVAGFEASEDDFSGEFMENLGKMMRAVGGDISAAFDSNNTIDPGIFKDQILEGDN